MRYPLNEVFGTHAHVRLLRVMAVEVEGPLTVADIARRTGLTVPDAQKGLGKLLRSSFVSRVGGGRKYQYEIRRSDPLMQITIGLFQSEKNLYERLISAIKNAIRALAPLPLIQVSRKLADIIQEDASLVRRAKDHIDRLLKEDQGAATGDIMEWRNILDAYPIHRLVRFVTSSSDRARRLRQSNPFFAILTSEERAKVADELGAQE